MLQLYFDMDGTIANLYGFQDWLPLLRRLDTKPYRHCAPMIDTGRFIPLCNYLRRKGYSFQVISWASKDNDEDYFRRVSRAKKDWLRQNFPHCFTRAFVVPYDFPKHEVVDPRGKVLFDDNEEVGRAWEEAGGIWVDVKSTDILDYLEGLC